MAIYRVSADPDRADAASEQVILAVDQPFSNHNGGMVAFGPDDMLYIGLGDGGDGGDPQGNGQNRNSLLGKLLRLSVSATGVVTIPSDNPLVGQPGTRAEIWSWGLRNPWRFSFDRATGDLYIGDVGQNAREEINVATDRPAFGQGRNYGWNIMEGSACFSASACDTTGLTPRSSSTVTATAGSVTGGYVYRGSALAAFAGHYFYADYCEDGALSVFPVPRPSTRRIGPRSAPAARSRASAKMRAASARADLVGARLSHRSGAIGAA